MSKPLPNCPKCQSEHTYKELNTIVCPMCAHEWTETIENANSNAKTYRDANGTQLTDGDTITLIKDLKIKGSSTVIKVGTKVKGIRLVEEGDGHDIDCKIKGFGAMKLKSEFVKKAKD